MVGGIRKLPGDLKVRVHMFAVDGRGLTRPLRFHVPTKILLISVEEYSDSLQVAIV